MDNAADKSVEKRRQFVEAWNKTMVDIWQERIFKLKVIDTSALYNSVTVVQTDTDDRVLDITLSESFLEYGIWQDTGSGRDTPRGNGGDLGHERRREARRWFSMKYYSSVMNLRDFLAESLGREFTSMFAGFDPRAAARH